MRGSKREILYIGKAVNLKRRVSSYFLRPSDARITRLVTKIKKIDHKKTNSALEALILESNLIKKHQPPFNIREKDDSSFLYIGITTDEFPRVLLVRGKEISQKSEQFCKTFGPFVYSGSLKEALRIMRKIFPWSVHNIKNKEKKACFDYQVGLCPGTCVGAISRKEYKKNIQNLSLFLSGKTERLVKSLRREMKNASKELEFEKAEKIKRQMFAFQHINDVAIISDESRQIPNSKAQKERLRRIEGYDISNISGKNAVGSMVVFVGGKSEKSLYRKFAIRGKSSPDDTGMLKEVLIRRLKHKEWPLPDLMLIDGGIGQINAIKAVLGANKAKIPVLGMIKGRDRKGTEVIGKIPLWTEHNTLIRVRDEAHRFAIQYHRKRRGASFIPRKPEV